MATLKHAGIVRTTLGAHGGYAMAADPAAVSIGRVIRLLDGALAPLGCVSLRYYEPCSCVDEATCPLRDVMLDVRDAMLEILDTETLAELAARDRAGRRSTRAAATPTRSRVGGRRRPSRSPGRSRCGAALPRGSAPLATPRTPSPRSPRPRGATQ